MGAVEAGEDLAFLHPVAILGVELDDREPVNAGRDLRFLARTRVPETNSRSTNSRFVAGTMVTAGGSTTRGVSAAD